MVIPDRMNWAALLKKKAYLKFFPSYTLMCGIPQGISAD